MKKRDDGMQHSYSTCPRCRCINSDENIVTVDGQTMCRRCMKALAEKQHSASPETPHP